MVRQSDDCGNEDDFLSYIVAVTYAIRSSKKVTRCCVLVIASYKMRVWEIIFDIFSIKEELEYIGLFVLLLLRLCLLHLFSFAFFGFPLLRVPKWTKNKSLCFVTSALKCKLLCRKSPSTCWKL